jgi:NADH:ubiquinone oxidoreductase subunit F (NADH-binding)
MTENEKKKPVKMEDVQAKADEKKCAVQKSLTYIEEFLAEPMCGRCFPCSMGSYETRIRLKKLKGGTAVDDDVSTVKTIAAVMAEASMCKRGKDTAKYILEQIDSKEFAEHLSGACTSAECTHYSLYVIVPEKCTMCGDCLDACKDNAILGEKKNKFLSGYLPFEIAQKRCTKCGECMKVCKYDAVKVVSAIEAAEAEKVGV